MRIRTLLAALLLGLAALACSWPDLLPPAAPEIEPTALPTFAIPTWTLAPSATAPPTASPTPSVPVARARDLGANCRYGPGTEWAVVSALQQGASAEILGRTSESTWWVVQDPLNPGEQCWVAADVTDTAGNVDLLPIREAPAALVTEVTASAAVSFSACGGPNAISFSGAITANGPAAVTYHWEVSGDAQNTTPDATLEFAEAGTQKVQAGAYSADCGGYSVQLVVTAPNELSARRDFSVQAP